MTPTDQHRADQIVTLIGLIPQLIETASPDALDDAHNRCLNLAEMLDGEAPEISRIYELFANYITDLAQ